MKASQWVWMLGLCLIPLLTHAQPRPDIIWRLGVVGSPTAISANGELFVSASQLTITLWHLPTHQLIRVIPLHRLWGVFPYDWHADIAISPDGTRLAIVGTIKERECSNPKVIFVLIEPQAGTVIRRLEFEEDTTGGAVAFSADGLHIAFPLNSGYTDTGNHLVIARASDGGVEQVLAAPFRIRALRYLADGRLLAACMQRENYYWIWPWIWEVFSNTQRRINHRYTWHETRWELAPNGNYLSIVESNDSSNINFALYDVNEARLIRFEELPFREASAVFSHDSQAFILAIRRYDYASRQYRTLLQVRQSSTGEVVRQWADIDWGGLLSHPFRSEVFVGNRILNWQTGEWVGQVGHFGELNPTNPIQFSPDSRLLITAGGREVSVWRLSDRALHYRLRFMKLIRHCLASPDGTLIVVVLRDYEDRFSQVYLYNLADGSLYRRLPDVDGNITTLRFSPDGSLLAVASAGVHLYRVVDGTLQGLIEDSGHPLVFSPDGRYLVTRRYVWQLPERLPVFAFNWTQWVGDEPNETYSAAFSKDGVWLAVGSVYDESWAYHDLELAGDFQLVRVGSWEPVAYRRDISAIAQLAFLPDGQHLIVGKNDSGGWMEGYHRDGSLHLWQLPGPVERVNRAGGRPQFTLSSTSRYLFALLHRAQANYGSPYYERNMLVLWHVHRGQVLRAQEYEEGIASEVGSPFAVAISPDERLIAFAQPSVVMVARNPLFTPYGDVNGDGCVDDLDLLAVLNAFGSTESAPDVDGDGRVDDADLLIVLFNFDAGC
jgi:dipeptidyl aminopeptidase/acylaminoacyl peptidase